MIGNAQRDGSAQHFDTRSPKRVSRKACSCELLVHRSSKNACVGNCERPASATCDPLLRDLHTRTSSALATAGLGQEALAHFLSSIRDERIHHLMLFSNIEADRHLVAQSSSRQTSNVQDGVITLSIVDKQRFNCWPFRHLQLPLCYCCPPTTPAAHHS